jgi:GT2 family glycosyltransferase
MIHRLVWFDIYTVMTIYALTLTHNGKQHLEKLQPSLEEASKYTSNDILWFIRDNNSNDGTEELTKSWSGEKVMDYYYFENHNRDNFSKCNNFLVNKVKGLTKPHPENDFYLLLNNDITIEDPRSIQYMVDIMNKDKDVGIVGAKLYYPGGGKIIQHFGVAMSPKHGNMPWHVYTGEKDGLYTQRTKEFQAVTGAFMLIRCGCFDSLKDGKMNEEYQWCFEDIDMCLDIKYLQNKKIVCCAKTNITHHESATLQKNPVNKMFMGHNVKTFKKNWDGKYKLDYFDYTKDPEYNVYK